MANKSIAQWFSSINPFQKKKTWSFKEARFVVFDTETTGLNPKRDKILSIGGVSIKDYAVAVDNNFECFIKQDLFKPETVKIHGIMKHGNLKKIDEREALKLFLNYVDGAILVAHHIGFDMAVLNVALMNHQLPKLSNKTIDTGVLYKKLNDTEGGPPSLDELCEKFNIVPHDRHTALGDAYLTALLFMKITSQLKQLKKLDYSTLFYTKKFKDGLI